MAKNKKEEWFNWKSSEWMMGKVMFKHHFTDKNGNGMFPLKVVIPKEDMECAGSHLKKLMTKKYKSVIFTPDKGNTKFLQLSFTNIPLEEKATR